MAASKLVTLHQEKSALLDEWRKTSGAHKMKILIRIMDIDEELSGVDRGGEPNVFGSRKRNALSSVFQKKQGI